LAFFTGERRGKTRKLFLAVGLIVSFIYGEFDTNIVKIHGELPMLAAASPSEKRLKKDIKPLESSMDEALELQGVRYHWKTEQHPDWGFEDAIQIGLVAQDVQAIFLNWSVRWFGRHHRGFFNYFTPISGDYRV